MIHELLQTLSNWSCFDAHRLWSWWCWDIVVKHRSCFHEFYQPGIKPRLATIPATEMQNHPEPSTAPPAPPPPPANSCLLPVKAVASTTIISASTSNVVVAVQQQWQHAQLWWHNGCTFCKDQREVETNKWGWKWCWKCHVQHIWVNSECLTLITLLKTSFHCHGHVCIAPHKHLLILQCGVKCKFDQRSALINQWIRQNSTIFIRQIPLTFAVVRCRNQGTTKICPPLDPLETKNFFPHCPPE